MRTELKGSGIVCPECGAHDTIVERKEISEYSKVSRIVRCHGESSGFYKVKILDVAAKYTLQCEDCGAEWETISDYWKALDHCNTKVSAGNGYPPSQGERRVSRQVVLTWDDLKKKVKREEFVLPPFDPELLHKKDKYLENDIGTRWLERALDAYYGHEFPISITVEEDKIGIWHLVSERTPIFSILGWIDAINWCDNYGTDINSYYATSDSKYKELREKYYHTTNSYLTMEKSDAIERAIEQSPVIVSVCHGKVLDTFREE